MGSQRDGRLVSSPGEASRPPIFIWACIFIKLPEPTICWCRPRRPLHFLLGWARDDSASARGLTRVLGGRDGGCEAQDCAEHQRNSCDCYRSFHVGAPFANDPEGSPNVSSKTSMKQYETDP